MGRVGGREGASGGGGSDDMREAGIGSGGRDGGLREGRWRKGTS